MTECFFLKHVFHVRFHRDLALLQWFIVQAGGWYILQDSPLDWFMPPFLWKKLTFQEFSLSHPITPWCYTCWWVGNSNHFGGIRGQFGESLKQRPGALIPYQGPPSGKQVCRIRRQLRDGFSWWVFRNVIHASFEDVCFNYHVILGSFRAVYFKCRFSTCFRNCHE